MIEMMLDLFHISNQSHGQEQLPENSQFKKRISSKGIRICI